MSIYLQMVINYLLSVSEINTNQKESVFILKVKAAPFEALVSTIRQNVYFEVLRFWFATHFFKFHYNSVVS